MKDAALALAAKGVRVFPVSPDKTPRTPRGFKDATTGPETIKSWNWDGALIGSPPENGTVVIDVDPRNGGCNTLDLFPALPPTRATQTPSGGWHYWFTVDPELQLRGTLGPGVDVKRAGKGYVIIPPSPGYAYAIFGKMQPLPQWLIDELVIQERPEHTASAPKFFPFQDGTPYGEAALRNALRALAQAPLGSRNEALNRTAFGLAQLVAGGELSYHAATEGLLATARLLDLPAYEVKRTIESGWTAGEQRPRQAPQNPPIVPDPEITEAIQ